VARTYGETWREVRSEVPLAPALTVQRWVRNAYKELCDERNWSFLRGEGEFRINVARSGEATITQGSPTVASTGGADGITFVASDVGRQLRTGNVGPPLTIIAVDLAGNTSATLERDWEGETNATATVTVGDHYATCPLDFGSFVVVIDPQNARLVRIFMTMQELNGADPGRYDTSTPWALVNYRLSDLTATLGQAQYEWWPYWTAASSLRFPFYYMKRPADLADDDYFEGPLRERSDVIYTGALAKAARWPGPSIERRNPFFNLALAAQLKTDFEYQRGLLEVKDEELYMTWLQDQEWARYHTDGFGVGPVDAAYIQTHE
jgi:hypothetical protein